MLGEVPDEHQREKHGDGGQGPGEDRGDDLFGPFFDSRLEILMLFVEVTFDILQDDDGIVGEHPQGQDDRRVDDDVELAAGEPDDRHRGEEDHRDRKPRGDDRPEVAQEDHDHQQGVDDGVAQGLEHVGIGGFDEVALGIGDGEVDIGIELRQLLHLGPGGFGDRQDAAAGGPLDGEGDSLLAVADVAAGALLVAPADGGDVPQAEIGKNRQLLEALDLIPLAVVGDGVEAVFALGEADGSILVDGEDRLGQLVEVYAVFFGLEGIHFDIDGALVAPEDLHVPDGRIAQKIGFDEAVGDLADVGDADIGVFGGGQGDHVHRQGEIPGGIDGGGDVAGQTAFGDGEGVGYVHGSRFEPFFIFELGLDDGEVGHVDGADIPDHGDPGDLLLDRLAHRIGGHFGGSAGDLGDDDDLGTVGVGEEVFGQEHQRRDSDDEKGQDQTVELIGAFVEIVKHRYRSPRSSRIGSRMTG